MKKILLSVSIIMLVAATSVGITASYFSDTEKSVGNTLSVGTIDISINDQNPWSQQFALKDMKPGYTDYINFEVQNAGPSANPVDVYKRIIIDPLTAFSTGVQTEPECIEENGTWDNAAKTCSTPTAEDNQIDKAIKYDLIVHVFDATGTEVWWQTIYDDEVSIKDVYYNPDNSAYDRYVYLGLIPAGGKMKVEQSYKMAEETTNWAQGDIMTFDIEVKAEQVKGKVVLDNKIEKKDDAYYWKITQADDIQGILTFVPKNPTFDFDFEGYAPSASTSYTLVVGTDPWFSGKTIDTAVSGADGSITLNGDVELSTDLKDKKVWLVLTADWNEAGMTAWNPTQYLFETGLIWYDDTNL